MRVLYLDCFSGISGDMTVGALCDLGVKPSTFEWELSKVGIGDFHMHFERQERKSIAGIKFGIHAGSTHTHDQDEPPDEHGQVHAHAHEAENRSEQPSHGSHEPSHHHHHVQTDLAEQLAHEHGDGCAHDHEHHHDHDHGRSYVEIRALIEDSDLSNFVKQHALSIFRRVGEAEAKIHGVPVEQIGFHEVGALDSIADIVLACVGIEELGVERIYLGKLADGHGWVDCAHGRFPIPAPATLEILRGIPVGQIDEPFEFITPTGAAIAAEFGRGFGTMPAMKIDRIGYGLGTRQLEKRPNVLRAVLGELTEDAQDADNPFATDTVTQIETNIDDLSPEILGATIDRLLGAKALDAFFTPAQMKKNRPGVLLTVLCEPEATGELVALLLRETSSFGVRLSDKRRLKLERRFETVQTPYGEITVKLGFDARGELLQTSPEFASCQAAADRSGQPLRQVYGAAIAASEAKAPRRN